MSRPTKDEEVTEKGVAVGGLVPPPESPLQRRFIEADRALVEALNDLEAAIERARQVIANRVHE